MSEAKRQRAVAAIRKAAELAMKGGTFKEALAKLTDDERHAIALVAAPENIEDIPEALASLERTFGGRSDGTWRGTESWR